MDFAGLFSSLQKFDQWSESPQILTQYFLLLFEMFLLYISLIYLLMCRSYDAFNADDMDWNLSAKTSIWKGHNSYSVRNT